VLDHAKVAGRLPTPSEAKRVRELKKVVAEATMGLEKWAKTKSRRDAAKKTAAKAKACGTSKAKKKAKKKGGKKAGKKLSGNAGLFSKGHKAKKVKGSHKRPTAKQIAARKKFAAAAKARAKASKKTGAKKTRKKAHKKSAKRTLAKRSSSSVSRGPVGGKYPVAGQRQRAATLAKELNSKAKKGELTANDVIRLSRANQVKSWICGGSSRSGCGGGSKRGHTVMVLNRG
jgi:hypothetical protein